MNETPTANIKLERVTDEQPHWLRPTEDCMGRMVQAHWRQFLTCFDGNVVLGYGETPEIAAANASLNRRDSEAVATRTLVEPKLRIQELLKSGCRGTREQEDFNKAVAVLLGVKV